MSDVLDKRNIDWAHSMRSKQMWWALGLFEGEGTIVPGKAMVLAMTDEDTVRRFHTVVGLGNVRGPYQNGPLGRKPLWVWKLCDRRTCYFLIQKWLPHFSEHRREQAQRYLDEVGKAPRRRRSHASRTS